jgi:adenylosuccinate synthase
MVDWGDYPYVTSSHCGVAGAIQNGIPFDKIRNVYGVAKAYDTYVGSKKFEKEDAIFQKIRDEGMEFGTTTGRPRQVGFLDLDLLKRSAILNGITHLVVNKVDILERVDCWKAVRNGKLEDWQDKQSFIRNTSEVLMKEIKTLKNIIFSESPKDI